MSLEVSMANRPNVLLIMCDQMRGDCLGIDAVSYTHLDVYKRQVPVAEDDGDDLDL